MIKHCPGMQGSVLDVTADRALLTKPIVRRLSSLCSNSSATDSVTAARAADRYELFTARHILAYIKLPAFRPADGLFERSKHEIAGLCRPS